jgi:cytochrome c-type biogenesis protein CcmH/NrfG
MGRSTVESLRTLGDIYINEDLMDLASRAYRKSIDLDGNKVVERPLRAAEILAARGAVSQARAVSAHLQKAWAGSLSNADRAKLLKLEARLNMAEGSGTEATAKVLKEILEFDPLDGEALMLLGKHYASNDQPDRAIFYYERAESLEAFEVIASIRHAQVLMSMNRYADAIPLLRRAQEIKPNEDVARYLEQVQRIADTSP